MTAIPADGEVLHFSEDPTLTRFEPHVAPHVGIGHSVRLGRGRGARAGILVPGQCPRAMA